MGGAEIGKAPDAPVEGVMEFTAPDADCRA
jgi:hypothetical protein